MRLLKTIFIFLLSALIIHPVIAQQWSYVYIQGDKHTPFYVKMDDEMLPRYSKHFYINVKA